MEILDHSTSSVRLGRLKEFGSVFFNHRMPGHPRDVISARIEDVKIGKDRIGRANIHFVEQDETTELVRKHVINRVINGISIGYRVHKAKLEETDEKKGDTYRIVDWEPYEISFVNSPADPTVGVGRDAEVENILIIEGEEMPDKANQESQPVENRSVEAPAVIPPKVDVEQVRREGAKSERERVAALMTMGREYDAEDIANELALSGGTPEDMNKRLLERLQSERTPVQYGDIGLSKKEVKEYRLFRALRVLNAASQGRDVRQAQKDAEFEMECSREIADQYNQEPKGVFIPVEYIRSSYQSQRVLTAGTATDGAELVATNLLTGSFIDVLRNLSVVMSAGARTLTDLVGDVAIPRKTSGSSAGWVAENGDVSESDAQFDQVTLTPRTVGAFTQISRQLLLQSSMDVEALIRDDLTSGVATAVDLAALYGSGASNQPTGVVNTTGIGDPTTWAGATPTWAEVVALETELMADNALMGSRAYITERSVSQAMKTTEKATNTAVFIMDGGRTNDYPVFVTNQVTSGDMIFGNWTDLLIGMWGGLDVLIDPYSGGLAGRIRVITHQSIDIAVRHPESFALGNDTI